MGKWKLAPGLNNVGSYQVSGQPYTTASCLAPASGAAFCLRFPSVTKWFQIEPTYGQAGECNLRVAFSENGLYGKGGYYFNLHASGNLVRPMDHKVTELWFMSNNDAQTVTFDVLAGLTNVAIGSAFTSQRTIKGVVEAGGPNWSGSIGVG